VNDGYVNGYKEDGTGDSSREVRPLPLLSALFRRELILSSSLCSGRV